MTFPAHEWGAHGGTTTHLKSVLLVEDNPNDFHLAVRELKKLKLENPIYHVSSIGAMIAYMKGEGEYTNRDEYPLPKLVLLDMRLNDADGLDAAAWLRSQSKFRKIAIVAISGSGPERLQSAVDMGAHALMLKPFQSSEFLKVLDKLQVKLDFGS